MNGHSSRGRRDDPNLLEVFSVIAASETGLSRWQIQEKTGLSNLAVKDAVDTLVYRGFIDWPSPVNLPSLKDPVSIIRNRYCVIGLKILPSEVLGVVTDLRCTRLSDGAGKKLPEGRHDVTTVVRALVDLVRELIGQVPDGYSVLGTGVELGGHVKSGVVIYSPNLQWRMVKLRRLLSEALDEGLKSAPAERFGSASRVVIVNDANALALQTQWFGAGSEHRSFALILVGDGIGCGLVINNRLIEGASGIAGEIGHLVIAPENHGLICRCGNFGCLEAIATIPMILQAIARAKEDKGQIPPATIADALELADKDELVAAAFEFAGEALARAISYLINLVNPEAIILEAYEPNVAERLRQITDTYLRRYCFSTAPGTFDIVMTDVVPERGARGAAAFMISGLLDHELPSYVSARAS